MKSIEFDRDKNEWLLKERGICFDDIIPLVIDEEIIEDIPHPNKNKYPKQRIMFLEFGGYIYAVPYVEDTKKIFLKTIYPSRKAQKLFGGEDEEER